MNKDRLFHYFYNKNEIQAITKYKTLQTNKQTVPSSFTTGVKKQEITFIQYRQSNHRISD